MLKDEWGFDGVVMSDWVATKSVVGAAEGGLDLQMPGPDGPWGDGLLDAVRAGDVSEALLDDKVLRLLRLAQRVGALEGVAPSGASRDRVADVDVRRRAARAGLPRRWSCSATTSTRCRCQPDDVTRIALLGPNAVHPFVQGGGCAFVRPDHLSTPEAAIREALRRGRGRRAPAAAVVPPAAAVARPGRPVHARPRATSARSASCSTPTARCWPPPT